ncbi:MAG: hypothetical protein LBG46_02995 [Elusimicrobiota bacterium]|jgi:hypothetical protein|nr:hypothetical protein [Elusimicrobiota bacterium]
MKNRDKIFRIEIAVAILLIILLWWGTIYKIMHLRENAQKSISARNHSKLTDSIAVYRGDHQGRCPDTLEELLKEHLEKIPHNYGADGKKNARVKNGARAEVFDGSGGWIYINEPADKDYCKVLPNIY